jgi:hypothetical protein
VVKNTEKSVISVKMRMKRSQRSTQLFLNHPRKLINLHLIA